METKLKNISLLFVLLLGSCAPTAPVPTVTPLATATPSPTAMPTVTPRPTIEQYLDPLVKDNYKDSIGSVEYEELVPSIRDNGEITATDYIPDAEFKRKVILA